MNSISAATKRKLALDYAQSVADASSSPVNRIEIADHYLSGLRKGLALAAADQQTPNYERRITHGNQEKGSKEEGNQEGSEEIAS